MPKSAALFRPHSEAGRTALVLGIQYCISFAAGCSKPAEVEPDPASQIASGPDEIAVSPYYARVAADVEQLSRMVRLHPTNGTLHMQLGTKLLEGGMTAEGVRHLRHALKLDPKLDDARVRLIDDSIGRQEVDTAETWLRAGLEVHETAALRTAEGHVWLARAPDEPSRARVAFERALALDPRSIDAAYELGRLALLEHDAATAEPLLARVVALRPNHLGAHFNRMRALKMLGQEDRAAEVAAIHRRLSRLDDLGQLDAYDSAEASCALADLYVAASDVESALAELEDAVRRFPSHVVSRVRLGDVLAQAGRHDDARAAFERALGEIPGNPVLLRGFATHLAAFARDGADRKRAVQLAERAVAITKRKDIDCLAALAEARAGNGDFAAALAAVGEALRLSPGDEQLEQKRMRFERRARGDG